MNFCQTDNMHSGKSIAVKSQLITVINDWARILDKGGQVDTFIVDFEKAFHTHPHELLKCKLYGYGIGGKPEMDRQQRVVINGVKSDWAPFCQVSPGHRSWTTVILIIHK